MKKIIASIFALTAVLSVNAANVSSNASATLQHNVTVSKVTTNGTYGTNTVVGGGDLLFGDILIDNDGGSVTVQHNNTADYSGVLEGADPTVAAAAFQVAGIQGNTYTVTIPNANIYRGGVTTAENLSIAFTNNATGTISGTTNNNVFMVGGTLTIPENSRVGSYSGSFSVTVEYN